MRITTHLVHPWRVRRDRGRVAALTDLLPAEGTAHLVMPLEERAQRIRSMLEQTAIGVGRELIAAKQEHPGRFMAWVADEVGYSIDTAERLMAVTRAFEGADEAMMAALPTATSALYELQRMPTHRLREVIDAGLVGPNSTVRDCRDLNRPQHEGEEKVEVHPPAPRRLDADIIAGELMRFPRSRLGGDAERRLRRWLG